MLHEFHVPHAPKWAQVDCFPLHFNWDLWYVANRDYCSSGFKLSLISLCVGYPNKPAADIALHTIRDFLEKNKDKVITNATFIMSVLN